MLERVQGVPLLAWLVAALAQSGARRFFLVAQAGWMSRAKACFPQDLDLTLCADQDPADLLHVSLSTADGRREDHGGDRSGGVSSQFWGQAPQRRL